MISPTDQQTIVNLIKSFAPTVYKFAGIPGDSPYDVPVKVGDIFINTKTGDIFMSSQATDLGPDLFWATIYP